MAKKLLTEEQVKKCLKIDSFHTLSKDKVIEFVSLIPRMDKDVAMSIINQFPEYVEYAGGMVTSMKGLCEVALEKADSSQMAAIAAYQTILNALSASLNQKRLSAEERDKITNDMIDVADKIADINTEHKTFIQHIVKCGSSVAVCAIALGACILGVKKN